MFFAGVSPPPRIIDAELIPSEQPFLAIFNHYESARAAAWWGPLLISGAIAARRTREPREVRWIMAREWWYPRGLGRWVKQPFTRVAFARLAQVYGLVLVPPILEGFTTRGEGMSGVRHALALTRGKTPALVGLAPEGRTGPGASLCEPPPGAGLFLLLLTHDTLPCVPVGIYEEGATLILRFGAPFQLTVPRTPDRDLRDRAAATQAMLAIGRLLPERLLGAYANR